MDRMVEPPGQNSPDRCSPPVERQCKGPRVASVVQRASESSPHAPAARDDAPCGRALPLDREFVGSGVVVARSFVGRRSPVVAVKGRTIEGER